MFQVHYLFETVRIRIRFRIKQPDPDPYQIEKQDPDPYQSEKQDPDQKCLDPKHCCSENREDVSELESAVDMLPVGGFSARDGT